MQTLLINTDSAPSSPSHSKTSKLTAAALLHLPGVRMHLVLTAILCLCFWVGIVYIGECVFAAIPWEALHEQSPLWYTLLDQTFYLLDVIVIVLVGLPLLYGACMIYEAAADGKKEPMTTLFCAFSSPSAYRRSLAAMIGLLLPPLLVAGSALWLNHLAKGTEQIWMAVLYYGLTLLLVVAACLLLGCHDAVLRLCYLHPDTSVFRLFSASRRVTRRRLFELFLFKLSYTGWWLLSVLSLGIVLIFHALPVFTLAYTVRLDVSDETKPLT